MTGRVINRETASFLILLIPLAIAAVVLQTAWPYLLALMGLAILWQIWQTYQWLKLCEQVNPFFNQLIKENKGCLTPMDLSLKVNLAGGTAKRFLEYKAAEYGAHSRALEDKGTVYYFLTASALGSILDDSEPLLEGESYSATPSQLSSSSSAKRIQFQETSVSNIAKLVELEEIKPTPDITPTEEPQPLAGNKLEFSPQPPETPTEEPQPLAGNKLEFSPQPPETPTEEPQPLAGTTKEVEQVEQKPSETLSLEDSQTQNNELSTQSDTRLELNQAELAKRLEINPSTVGRRKSKPDFAEWSQSKDPDGIAWKYVPKREIFVSLAPE